MHELNATDAYCHSVTVQVDKLYIDYCPHCRRTGEHREMGNYLNGLKTTSEVLYRVCRCTNMECSNMFLAIYMGVKQHHSEDNYYFFKGCVPNIPAPPKFPEIIRSVSKNFAELYTQAFLADEYNLKNICGAGYRKALEFLIKDYIIHKKD